MRKFFAIDLNKRELKMKNETISKSYALALLEISEESKIDVKKDLDLIWNLIRKIVT